MACDTFITRGEFDALARQVTNTLSKLSSRITTVERDLTNIRTDLDNHTELSICGGVHNGITDVTVKLDGKGDKLKAFIGVCKVVASDSTTLEGLKGEKGEDGRKGDKGERGKPGEKGKDGRDGRNGKDGQDGTDGRDGAKGDRGDRGLSGRSGRNGVDGRNGRDGRNGFNGVNGRDGRNGKDGKPGERGPRGIQGEKGDRGSRGFDGRDGKDGARGEQGLRGVPGKDGASGSDAPSIIRASLNFSNDRMNYTLLTSDGSRINSNTVNLDMSDPRIQQILDCCTRVEDSLIFEPVEVDLLKCETSTVSDNGLVAVDSGVGLEVTDLRQTVIALSEKLTSLHEDICSTAVGLITPPNLLPPYVCEEVESEDCETTTVIQRTDTDDPDYIDAISRLDDLPLSGVNLSTYLTTLDRVNYDLMGVQIAKSLEQICTLEVGEGATSLVVESRAAISKRSELRILFAPQEEIYCKSVSRTQVVHIPNPISAEELCDFDTYFAPITKTSGRYYCYVRYSNTSTTTAHYGNIIPGDAGIDTSDVDDYFDKLALLTTEEETDRRYVVRKNIPPRKLEGTIFKVWRAKRVDIIDGEQTNVVVFRAIPPTTTLV